MAPPRRPAAAALVNLALLLPTAQALVLGAMTLTADRESGFGAMLLARGVRPAALVVTAWLAVTLSSWLSIAAGFGLAVIVIAGNVPPGDLPVFVGLIGVSLAASAAGAARRSLRSSSPGRCCRSPSRRRGWRAGTADERRETRYRPAHAVLPLLGQPRFIRRARWSSCC